MRPEKMQPPACVLFDMDGVLIDSESLMRRAGAEMFNQYGVPCVPEDFRPFTGMDEEGFFGGVMRQYGRPYDPALKDQVYARYAVLAQTALFPCPGAGETLRKLREMGVKTALATSADDVKLEMNLKAAFLTRASFDFVACGRDLKRKKPFPDIYLLAAERLGATSDMCLVVEDALSGIAAAVAAKMRVVAVEGSFEKETLLAAGAECVLPNVGALCGYLFPEK